MNKLIESDFPSLFHALEEESKASWAEAESVDYLMAFRSFKPSQILYGPLPKYGSCPSLGYFSKNPVVLGMNRGIIAPPSKKQYRRNHLEYLYDQKGEIRYVKSISGFDHHLFGAFLVSEGRAVLFDEKGALQQIILWGEEGGLPFETEFSFRYLPEIDKRIILDESYFLSLQSTPILRDVFLHRFEGKNLYQSAKIFLKEKEDDEIEGNGLISKEWLFGVKNTITSETSKLGEHPSEKEVETGLESLFGKFPSVTEKPNSNPSKKAMAPSKPEKGTEGKRTLNFSDAKRLFGLEVGDLFHLDEYSEKHPLLMADNGITRNDLIRWQHEDILGICEERAHLLNQATEVKEAVDLLGLALDGFEYPDRLTLEESVAVLELFSRDENAEFWSAAFAYGQADKAGCSERNRVAQSLAIDYDVFERDFDEIPGYLTTNPDRFCGLIPFLKKKGFDDLYFRAVKVILAKGEIAFEPLLPVMISLANFSKGNDPSLHRKVMGLFKKAVEARELSLGRPLKTDEYCCGYVLVRPEWGQKSVREALGGPLSSR